MDDLSIILDWAKNIDDVASHVKFSSRSVQLSGNRVKFAVLAMSYDRRRKFASQQNDGIDSRYG